MLAHSGSKLASLRPVGVCAKHQQHEHGHSYYANIDTAARSATHTTIQTNTEGNETLYKTIESAMQVYNNAVTQSSP